MYVRYLLGEYRIALVDLFGPNALPLEKAEKAARRDVKTRVSSGPPRALVQEPSKVARGRS